MGKYSAVISGLALALLVGGALPIATASAASIGQPRAQQPAPETRNLIIYYSAENPERAKSNILGAARLYGAEVVYVLETLHAVVVRIPEGKSLSKAKTYFKAVPGVLTVNEDQVVQLDGQ